MGNERSRHRRTGRSRQRRSGRARRAWAATGAALLALPLALVPAIPAAAADWGISKQEVPGGPYEPGDTVQWIITVSCSDPNADPCTDAVLTDSLPDGLELVSASVQSGPAGGEIDADTDTGTVTYTNPEVPNGAQAQIIVTARVSPDLPYSADGVPITNTATVVADNAAQQQASDAITPVVPLVLASTTTKSIDPPGALAAPGTTATMTIGATNTSNDPVDTLVLQDPVDPTATPNPFTYLEYTGTGTVVLPPNADTVTTQYWDGDSWETLDGSVDPATVQGVRYTFSGDIQPGATASVPVQVQQSDAVDDLTDATTVTNDASSSVTHARTSTPTTASDTYVITPPDNSVTASKSFSPTTVSAGDPTTVTIGATNTGTAVDSLTITEPAPGTDNPFEGDDPLTFTGFGPTGDGTGVQWPSGANGATVTFTCADGSAPEVAATAPNTLPNPPGGCVVVGFTVVFTGDLPTGAAASIPFTADTDPDQTTDDVAHTNTIEATVPSADPATAPADLVTLVDRLATSTTKLMSPSTIPAVPGQSVIVQLPTQLLPFGPDGSTANADQVVVQDPVDPANPGEFWSSFTATAVRTTDVPAGSTLTVNYWNGSAWVQAPACGPYTGPATVSCELPAGAGGVQFVYDSTGDGFPPGTQFQPNFTAEYTGPADRDTPIQNCGASSASSGTVDPTPPAQGCASVDPFPVDGPGALEFVTKDFLGGTPPSVLARSDDQVTAQITWSTNGFSGVDPMVISDIADPQSTPIASSFYDAFDLVRVEAIDTATDPLISYDQVTGVELFIGGTWVPASGDPCPCVGSFPGYTLSPEEQASATSVRLTYEESPDRTTTGDPTAPQPGDGVARSTLADGRHLDLTFQVRDDKRSDPSAPVLGSTQGTLYNSTDPGIVLDTVRGTGTFDTTQYTDTDTADVLIIDQPLNVTVAKDWTGGPISVPPSDTPAQFYPTTDVTIAGTNASAAKVSQLRLVEPGIATSGDVQTAPGTKPFDAFTLRAITLEPPEGAETTTVTLTYLGGSIASFTEAEAEALGTGDLADVVGVVTSFDGLVAPGATGSMDLTLQLRENDRYTQTPVTVAGYSPVPDGAVATIADPGGTDQDVRLAYDDASMVLQDAGIALDVGKTFDPTQIVEPGTGPVTMTLSGQPLGPSRAVEMVLVDDDPRFWNQYDFAAFAGAALTAPIQRVRVDAFTGGEFVTGPGGVVVNGGSWVLGDEVATFALPDGVSPADVQGLRFTFSRTDGSIWENPANPTQTVPVSVERREEMRTGGPVLTDLAANAPAPGESAPGVATNTVDGTVTGADLVVDPGSGELAPVSATDTETAPLVYAHATNGVQVVKTFAGDVTGGTQPPDGTFPMSIAVTNTGNRAIGELVVEDAPMPTDAQGAQLRLADVDDPYSYLLTGPPPAPAEGDPLPVDPDEVTVTQTGDLLGLRFSFPEGTVLGVGQTYTITVLVRFRVGLAPQTLVTNTAGATADRPWDQCQTRLDAQTGACEADADVTPIPAGVLAQSKLVRPTNDDALAVIVDPAYTGPPVECTPLPTGLYAYPCTPVIAPGHEQTWHVRIDNVGNLPMNKIVAYDRLPAVGDTGSSSSTSPRGSQWSPILTNDPPPALVNAPEGSTASFFYTTAVDYCMDDLTDPLAEPTCPTDDPATGWVQLTGTEDAALLATVTALKFVITFPDADPFQPGEYVAIEGTTLTPAVPPEAGDRSIAWNSAAASAVVVTPQGNLNLLPAEGTKVGVATATGPLEVTKRVAGAGAVNAPATFDLFVQCTSAPGTPVETVLDPIPITVARNSPVTVPNLPYGAVCTITEDGSDGQTELIVGTATIGESPDVTTITATNRYDLASIEVSKEVVTDAEDQDGQPVPFGPFEVTVDCTFLGEPVYATGYGPDDPMVVEIEDDQTVELDGLPVGAVCTVEETGTGNASSVTVTVTQQTDPPVTTPGASTTLTLVADTDEGESTNDVVLTNTYDVGGLDLLKVVEGQGAPTYGAGPFALAVRCTFDDDGSGPGDPRVVYDDTVVLGAGAPLEAQIVNLPAGAVCDVTEPDDGGATSTTIDPSPVTVAAGTAVAVTATNTFDVGAVTVDKVVDGEGADLYGAGPFTVTLTCTVDGQALSVPGGPTRTLVPGTPVVYDDLPVGAACTVAETEDGGASASSMTVTVGGGGAVETDGPSADVVVPPVDAQGAPTTVGVVATNTFDLGSLVVDKVVDGEGATLYGAGPFEVSLACTFDGQAVDIPGGAARELVPGEPVAYVGLPVGAQCEVTETATGGATTTAVTAVGDGEAGAVVVPAGDAGSVTVTNTFDVGEVRVVKTLAGADAAEHQGDVFTVSLACTQDVDGVPVDVVVPGGPTRTLSAADDWVAVYEDLPQGATCVVGETDAGGADTVQVVVDGESTLTDPATAVPESVEFDLPVGPDVCEPVEVVNTWSPTGGGMGGGTAVHHALTTALTPTEVALAAGCDRAAPDGALPGTGVDLARVGMLVAILLVLGTTALVAVRRRDA
ncbi:DUF5979 domain-containing protein [Oerskovia paurometabola]|uniref:DUF5979 domain-containing protein n=1 Tax=Oerskovia paurometabola TaxID=162170 RepID=UPI0037FD880B